MDVLKILRTGREQFRGDLEQLAGRLFKGEEIAPQALVADLLRIGCTDHQLQAEIDRLTRRAELHATIAAARGVRKQLAALETERGRLVTTLQAAAAALDQFDVERAGAMAAMRSSVTAAERAEVDLLMPKNLAAADRTVLIDAQTQRDAAQERATAAAAAVTQAEAMLADRQQRLAEATATAKQQPESPGLQEIVDRFANAVQARGAAVATAIEEARTAAAAADAARDACRQIEERLRRGTT